MKKNLYFIISVFILAASGFLVFAQENSSFTLTQLFPGQYDNTKFSISLADPEGIGAATINKANGDWILGAGRSCLQQFNTGTITLLSQDFPLKASLTDCKGNKYETSIFPLGTFPVAELGNCANEKECIAYCDKPENMGPCLDFSEKNNLRAKEDIEMGRRMLSAGQTSGPGGCRGTEECGEYCDDISHIQECVAFAEEHNLMPEEELAEAKKVAAALERGVQLPPCGSKTACDDVCKKPENMKACITFAKEAGLMTPEDMEEAEKVLAAIEKGITPPPCGGKDECDEYCGLPENFENCIAFAEAAGFMSPEEAIMVRKTGGKGPGGCRGREACDAYCEDPAHGEECINFAIENGFMSSEDGEQAKKMLAAGMNIMQGGPGGCKGKEECEAYCDDFTHLTECVDFSEKAGFMSAEDAARARQMAERGINMMEGGPGGCKSDKECRSFCEEPANLETCMDFAVQIGDMTQEEADQSRQRLGNMEEMNRKMQECLTMPCEEAFACFQGIQSGGEGSGQPPEGEEGAPEGVTGGINAEVQAKLEACAQEMQQQFQEGMMPEGMMPPEGEMPIYDESRGGPAPFIPEGPSQEEINRMMEEETQRKMQQIMEEEQQRIMQGEIDRMMEQQSAPPTGEQPPQSFFETVKNFLAGLVPEFY